MMINTSCKQCHRVVSLYDNDEIETGVCANCTLYGQILIARRAKQKAEHPAELSPMGWDGQLACYLRSGHERSNAPRHVGLPKLINIDNHNAWYYGQCLKCGWYIAYDQETLGWFKSTVPLRENKLSDTVRTIVKTIPPPPPPEWL